MARTLHRNNFSKESVITWVTDSSHYDFSLPRHNSPACPVVHKYIAGLKTLPSAPAHGTEPVPAAESIALTLLGGPVVHISDTNDWRNMALGVSKKPALVIPLYVTAKDFLTKWRVRDAQFPLDFKRTWEPNLILFLYRSRSRSTKETTERMLESSSGLKVLAIARGNTRCVCGKMQKSFGSGPSHLPFTGTLPHSLQGKFKVQILFYRSLLSPDRGAVSLTVVFHHYLQDSVAPGPSTESQKALTLDLSKLC